MDSISVEKIKNSSIDAGSIFGGMVAANVGVKLAKQDNLIANGALAVAGLLGASLVKNGPMRMALIGVTVFGAMRVATIGLTGANSLTGVLPEGIKDKIRTYLPQMNGVEGLGYLGEGEDDFGAIDLDDPATVDSDYEEVSSTVNGLGNLGDAEKLLV